MKLSKRTIIIIVVLLVIALLWWNYNKKQKAKQAIYDQQLQSQQTTGSAFLGYLSNLWTKKQSDGSMSEEEALAMSQKIADFIETESEAGQQQANAMIQELYANGWEYVGYNNVKPVA